MKKLIAIVALQLAAAAHACDLDCRLRQIDRDYERAVDRLERNADEDRRAFNRQLDDDYRLRQYQQDEQWRRDEERLRRKLRGEKVYPGY